MDLATLTRLLAPDGQAAVGAAAALDPGEATFLTCLGRLEKLFDRDLARAALETVILRGRARAKFSRADHMYFTREGLEQASGEAIAHYRAARFTPFARVADLGCGLGGDAIGLSAVTAVTLVDRDPVRLALARANLAAYGRAADSVTADLNVDPIPAAAGLWFDPARRAGGRRAFSVRDYQPPLAVIARWLPGTPALGVKVSPGVDLAELDEGTWRQTGSGNQQPAFEIEFISVAGDLKECVLWFGPLRTAERRATLLPGPHTLTSRVIPPPTVGQPARYLYEPDPAILRAGLVTVLAGQLGARQLDADIAYLTADALTPTPFARAFALDDAFPFQLKRLREYLRARNVGAVTVKKRGSPLEPEALIHKLKLKGDERRIVFLTHAAGRPYALVGREAVSPGAAKD
jgi:hypothetical protein